MTIWISFSEALCYPPCGKKVQVVVVHIICACIFSPSKIPPGFFLPSTVRGSLQASITAQGERCRLNDSMAHA